MIRDRLSVGDEVAAALAAGRAVVALESTLISHGLPYPQNVEVARASEASVREAGAVPATVAIRGGRLLVGLDEAALLALATAPAGSVRKAARPSLAAALADGGWAATTVSATMIAAHAAGISVFATGGIGGVHRGALAGTRGRAGAVMGETGVAGPDPGEAGARTGEAGAAGPGATAGSGAGGLGIAGPTFDISSDLEELGRTPMAVVCAGPKAILDVPATLEYLETRGVPVVAVGQAELPGFYARSAGIPAPDSVPDVAAAARLVATHLGMDLGSAVLVCVPVPEAEALPENVARDAVARAIDEAEAAAIGGPALTPWLLARIADITAGASVRANTALIVNDARIAAELAVLLRSIPTP